MRIVHLSDLHIAGGNKKTYGIAPMAENLALCVKHINQLKPKPDLVIVTGDITAGGLIEEAERAASLLEKLEYPFYIVPGNHDDRSSLWSVFSENGCPSRDQGFFNYVVEGYDVRLIGMDSTAPDEKGGVICETRSMWLDERLAEEKEKATILFMHHPPVKFGVEETDIDGFIGAEMLGDVVEKYTNIERVICGHIHLPAHTGWRGTVISTAPSMGMELVSDFTLERPSEYKLEAPGYLLHCWLPEKTLVSHATYVRSIDGPYPFKELPKPEAHKNITI